MISRVKKSICALLACMTVLSLVLAVSAPAKVSAASDVTVDLAAEEQVIRGFGGMNHPIWIRDLTADQRETAFGNGENQLGFSILRIHIDENKENWYKEVDTAKSAIANGAIVFASPWNPPSEMTETYINNFGNTVKRLKYDMYDDYAEYLNEFVAYMKDNGVDLYAISIQNEPDPTFSPSWTKYTPEEMLRFMKENAGSINCRVMAPESFGYKKGMSDPLLNDAQALANLDILGAHTYGTLIRELPYPLFKEKGVGKDLWMTEVYTPNSDPNSADRWPEALEVSYHMNEVLVEGDFQTYVWWYIRRDYGPMKEDGTISKRGYNMAHFSKFIRPGYVRVEATKNPDTDVHTSAYKGDNKVVIVAINKGTSAVSQNFVLQNGTASTVASWVTDGSRNLEAQPSIEASGSSFTARLPAQSVTTFVADYTDNTRSNTTYEAEKNTTLTHSVVETTFSGYNGTGYVNFEAASDAAVQWDHIYCSFTGTKNVKFRYALQTGTRTVDIYVNGAKVISNADFSATGSWSTWSEKTIQVPMDSGTNTLKVVTTGTEGPNIDSINVSAQ